MGSVNKAIIIGNLGKDPEVRYTPSGQPVANFTVATNERYTDKAGQAQERTEWHRIVVWGKSAEHCGQYLKKGRAVYVEGRLQTREWTDKEGKKNYTTEIVAAPVGGVVFLGSRDGGGRGDDFAPPPATDFEPAAPASGPGPTGPTGRGGGDEEIPF